MIYCNGEFLAANAPTIMTNNRGFLFADGIFTTVKVVDGHMQFFEEHCERFSSHCKAMGFLPPKVTLDVFIKLIECNQAQNGVWKLKIIATAKARQRDRLGLQEAEWYAFTLEPYFDEIKKDYALKTYSEPIVTPLSRLKSLACAARFVILEDAARNGCDDGLVLSPEGYVTETAFANFFWRVDNTLYTPSSALPLLRGITIQQVEKIAKHIGLDWQEVKRTPQEIPEEAQLYICNSMKGIVPIAVYDGISFKRDLPFDHILQTEYNRLRSL